MFLDLTKYKCPITFVKAKIALEKLRKHESLIIKINEGEDLNNMPESLKEIGFKIIKKKKYKKILLKSLLSIFN
tara:strand:- start:643 stop:864 length:222 start_codon:yes stop_codon:yes gene_type:complete